MCKGSCIFGTSHCNDTPSSMEKMKKIAIFFSLNRAKARRALIFKDKVITFGELRQTVDNWAAYLQAKGLQKGERVGLFSKNCPEFVAAYHAIVKAGGVVVPINFMLSPTETSFIIKDASVKMMFVQEVIDLEAALAKRGCDL